MTGGGILAVVLGTALIFFGFGGGWLPVKLLRVLTGYHLFCGRTLLLLEKHRPPRTGFLSLAVVPCCSPS